MLAEVEQLDGTYKVVEMGEPICGEDFCDTCGDCIACLQCDTTECTRWVIYIDNPKNPNFKQRQAGQVWEVRQTP